MRRSMTGHICLVKNYRSCLTLRACPARLSVRCTVVGKATDAGKEAVRLLTAEALRNLGIDPDESGAARRLADRLGMRDRDDERRLRRLVKGTTDAQLSSLLPILLTGNLLNVTKQTKDRLLALALTAQREAAEQATLAATSSSSERARRARGSRAKGA